MSIENDVEQINAALAWKCERCSSTDVDVRRVDPIPNVPVAIYAYRCRPCGLDSTKRMVTVLLTLAELDIMMLGLQQLKTQYPKVTPLIEHLGSLHEKNCCPRFEHGDGTHDPTCIYFRGDEAETKAAE